MTHIIFIFSLIISVLFFQKTTAKKKNRFFLYLLVGILLVGVNVIVQSKIENKFVISVSQNENDKKPQEKKNSFVIG